MALSPKKRRSPYKIATLLLSFGLLALIIGLKVSRSSFPVLQAAGPVAAGEQQMLVKAFLLMLIIVLPVFVLLFSFAWRYRESNKATYRPNWDGNRFAELTWWTVPTLLIITLSIMTWRGTYAYDPYKPLASNQKPLHVQVIALDWRWLFIYPEQHVASINQLPMPVNRPVQFDITADAPMNSFWIPQLGGQIYAMPGMTTKLNLLATKTGNYYGSSANISGKGFASMHFNAVVTSGADFERWVAKASNAATLSRGMYADIAKPSSDAGVHYFSNPSTTLFDNTVARYMTMNMNSANNSMQMNANMHMEGM